MTAAPKDRAMERMTLTKLGTLVEKLASDFRLFGEKLTAVSLKVDALDKRVAHIESRLDTMEPILKTLAPVPNQLEELSRRVSTLQGVV